MNEIETKFFEAFDNYVFQNPNLELTSSDGCKYAELQIRFNPTESKTTRMLFTNGFSFDLSIFDCENGMKPVSETFSVANDDNKDFGFEGYKPDFIISGKHSPFNYAIEIDGHQWHEKTKEQASYDKRKDRIYVKNCYVPIRFAGTDVYHNVIQCVKEIIEICGNNIYQSLLHCYINNLSKNNGDRK